MLDGVVAKSIPEGASTESIGEEMIVAKPKAPLADVEVLAVKPPLAYETIMIVDDAVKPPLAFMIVDHYEVV